MTTRLDPGSATTPLRRFPMRRRLLRALRRVANRARRRLRSLLTTTSDVLLVCAEPNGAKADELERRLAFFLAPALAAGCRISVRRANRVSLRDIILARAVALGDADRLPRVAARLADHIFNVDYDTNPLDGWELARLASEMRARHPDGRHASRDRFRALVTEMRRGSHSCTYLFGTGPSLGRAREHRFQDGHIVVCNTIVRDEALWHHLSPRILVAGDAIYHFGHTAHARAFRHDALARLSAPGARTFFVYPEIFDPIVRFEFAAVSDRLIPVPIGEHTDISVDLARHFALPDLGNVLNLLLLPVGCTLSRDVRLWGFDGRAPSDVLFWANSHLHSYSDLLQTVRDAHPAFFATLVPTGRESSYVRAVHGDALDEQLSHAEQRGFRFSMLHFSWTPTLQKRGTSARPDEALPQ